MLGLKLIHVSKRVTGLKNYLGEPNDNVNDNDNINDKVNSKLKRSRTPLLRWFTFNPNIDQ